MRIKEPRHLFCFGLGYSAQVLADHLLTSGWQVSGTCRTERKARSLRDRGITAWRFDDGYAIADTDTAFAGVTHVLSSVPPGDGNDPVLGQHRADLAALADQLVWIGYLSTIGVYGDQQGRWIDEDCPPAPISATSRRRVDAEQQWLALGRELGVPAHVFRLPGIYGPGGRNQIDAVRAGRAHRVVKPGQVFNRIHVDDLAAVLIASMDARDGASVYNVADDQPAPADQVIAYAAELLGVDPPPAVPFDKAQLSPFAAHFYAECKRVRNQRIKQELGINLRYPTFRQGLAAILKGA